MLVDFDPDLLTIGSLKITWYGVLFALGFGISRFIVKHMFVKEGRWRPESDILLVYMLAGTIIGARLGHVMFYAPFNYLSHPIDILKIWEGGLSSHGTSFGILSAVALYCYHWKWSERKFVKTDREGYKYLQVIDRMVIVVAFGAIFIRTGNFLNAEAIGTETSTTFGVFHSLPIERDLKSRLGSIESITTDYISKDSISFSLHFPTRIQNREVIERHRELVIKPRLENFLTNSTPSLKKVYSSEIGYNTDHYVIRFKVQPLYRHAAQLYEAITYLLLFVVIFSYWNRYKIQSRPGRIFGIFLLILFGSRIMWEFLKVESSTVTNDFLTMGQVLSIPFFILGLYMLKKK